MSDKKDQAPNPPSQESTGLNAETMSSNSNYDDFFFPMNKKMKVYQLQRQAYYDVLYAFAAESSAISSQGITIINELKKEWNIAYKTHIAYENKIKADRLVQQLRGTSLASGEKEKQTVAAAEEQKITAVQGNHLKPRLNLNDEYEDILQFLEKLNAAPAKMQKEKAKPSSSPDDSAILSWGQVSPAPLVNRWINIRMPGEDNYIPFLIEKYDAETEMHYLVTAPSKNDLVDPCNWIDLRHFPGEDTVWDEEHPGFPTRKCFLKPGETILHATSTAREKKQLNEVGKTASGIPIIRKLDKGK